MNITQCLTPMEITLNSLRTKSESKQMLKYVKNAHL